MKTAESPSEWTPMRDDKTTDFKTGSPLPPENPTGVIDGQTGRLFSRLDVESLQSVDRLVLLQETERFLREEPEARRDEVNRFNGAWSRVYGGAPVGPGRWVAQVERRVEVSFYDRLERWVTQRAAAPTDEERTRAFEQANEVAREAAREAIPEAWQAFLRANEESAQAFRALQEEDRRHARAFVEKHAADLHPTEPDLSELARRVFEAFFTSTDGMVEAEAAKTNPLLRAAIREYDEWHARHEALLQAHGNGPEAQLEAKRQNAVTAPRVFALHWPAIRHEWEIEHAPRLGVGRALAGVLKSEPGATEGERRLREAVAVELERSQFADEVGWPWPARHDETEADGMPAPRARLVAYLRKRFSPKGDGPAAKWISGLEVSGRESFAKWKQQERLEGVEAVSPWQKLTPSLAASLVAQVLWFNRVRAELERERSSSPALVAQVHADVGLFFRRGDLQRELELQGPGLAWVAVDNAEDAARLFGAGATLTFQRVIRHLPTVAHDTWRRTQRDEADVVIEGGFAALAKAIGAKSKKAAAEVRDALQLGSAIRREWSDGSEAQGLWTYHATPAAPDRPARLVITLAAAFRPGFVHQLPKGTGRTLVPVVPLPALVGANNFHAVQAALQWEVTRRLSEGRKEAAGEGGVTISPADWKRMADRVGLPARLLPTVLEAWQTGRDPFLENVRGDLWTIANSPPFAPAREWLLAQAEMANHGRKRGLRAAAKKRTVRKGPKS